MKTVKTEKGLNFDADNFFIGQNQSFFHFILK
jgi:hypothetical protein